MIAPLLLDTCAAIWILDDAPLSDSAVAAIDAAYDSGTPTHVSPITAWEAALLARRGRLAATLTAERWFDRLVAVPGVVLAAMPPAILIASTSLPGDSPRDPADCIIVATAREYGYRVLTRDRAILDYAQKGFVLALEC